MRSLSLGSAAAYSPRRNSVPGPPIPHGIGNLPAACGTMGIYSSGNNGGPPEISEQRKAMEAASAKERARAKALEESEREMTADELRAVLKKERMRTVKIQADLAALRSGTVQQQLQAEVLEEGRINGLMRRLDVLQEEKGRIIVELEREEGELRKMIVYLAFEPQELED